MRNLCKILFSKVIKKSVSEAMEPMPNRELWRFVIQTVISILTAILTALGASSCVSALM